jgi:hypothetical protein
MSVAPARAASIRRLPTAAILGWASLFLIVAVQYAEPIQDGDLFWHMAYARQMLARGTLVLDHAAFSWTPASNAMIYCAWLSELALYWLWEHVGPWSLFALRYAVLFGIVGLAARYAWLAGAGRTILTPLLLILLILASRTGTAIKPELFSMLLLSAVLFVYFRAKLARVLGREPSASFYLVPLLVLIWVNAHGGFVLIAPFLAASAAGEAMNALVSPALAFSRRGLKHLAAAWALCGVAVTLTPYGWRYPVQLFDDYVLGQTARPDVAWNSAHRAVLDATSLPLHLAEYSVLFGALLVTLLIVLYKTRGRGARVDCAVVLVNVAYLALYFPQLRTTYFWPAAVTYSAFYLIRAAHHRSRDDVDRWLNALPTGQAIVSVAIGLLLFIGARAVYEARYKPLERSWLGFGIGNVNPVAEAEFLAAAGLGPRIYNIFDSGGYLLWRLDPAYKVMVDQRSFPYLSWFDDQYRFSIGESFEEFLRKYPADVALIDLAKADCVRNFVRAPDWQLAYYGPTAAVFVKRDVGVPEAARRVAPDRFQVLRSPSTTVQLFEFATFIGDGGTARAVLAEMQTRHRRSLDAAYLRRAAETVQRMP